MAFLVGDANGRDAVKIFAFCLMRITATRFCSQFTKVSEQVHALAANWCNDANVLYERTGAREMKSKVGP